MAQGSVLQPNFLLKPDITMQSCKMIIEEYYDLYCSNVKELNGYDDKNFHVSVVPKVTNVHLKTLCKDGYVFKILNLLDSKNPMFIEAQTSLLIFLNENGIRCPKPIKNKFGQYIFPKELKSGEHIMRLLEFIPGQLLHEVSISDNLAYNVGITAGKLDLLMQKFQNQSYKSYTSIWMLNSVPRLREFIFAVKEVEKTEIFNRIIDEFEIKVLKKYDRLTKGLIHGDINEQNLIVRDGTVSGILDFGDSHYSCYLFEISIAMTYTMLTAKSVNSGGHVLAGYMKSIKLSDFELSLLPISIQARLTQSLILGAYTFQRDPKNIYVLTTAENGWNLLNEIINQSSEDLLLNLKSIANAYC